MQRIKEKAFNDYSRLTVVTGRRRIGKTSLILKSCDDTPTVYLFVSRSNVLESYFKDRMKESQQFRNIGSWWESKSNADQNEIDIVGIYSKENKALVVEVKRQGKNFKLELLNRKIDAIRTKVLYTYEIEAKYFSMDDM